MPLLSKVQLRINLNEVQQNSGICPRDCTRTCAAVSQNKLYLPSSFISMPRPRNEQWPSVAVTSEGIPSIDPLLSKSRTLYT
jgi:hypothetical protein